MSNMFYENKKMQIKRSLQLLDSVVMPVGLFSAEFLTILSLPERSLHDLNSLLTSWENFPLEKINQRACRMLLSVNKKSSKLAVLSELGRYPMFINALLLTLKYEQVIVEEENDSEL